jgi:hypothetical protein
MDIDIDTPSSFDPTTLFDVVRASMVKDDQLKRHPCGVYFQNIPVDKVTKLAAIPHEEAEDLGYFKIDFLHLSLLDYFDNKQQIRTLLTKQPNWELLLDDDVIPKLFQLHKYGKLLKKVKPTSIVELADTIALIRPAKHHLIDQYIQTADKSKLRKTLYTKPEDGRYYYKYSHAVSYAHIIVLQLHLIRAGII